MRRTVTSLMLLRPSMRTRREGAALSGDRSWMLFAYRSRNTRFGVAEGVEAGRQGGGGGGGGAKAGHSLFLEGTVRIGARVRQSLEAERSSRREGKAGEGVRDSRGLTGQVAYHMDVVVLVVEKPETVFAQHLAA